jgi:hypothetical protein
MPELAGSLHNSSADRDALTAGSPAPSDKGMPRHRGLTWHGYLVQLLHIASSIEHALMIQYLYAAYSLGGEKLERAEDRKKVEEWRELLLSIAREEMGHLLTVQNVLCLLGGPIELVRRNFPWDSGFYPFDFRLQRLTVKSLALYQYAEMGDHPPSGITLDNFKKAFNKLFKPAAVQEAGLQLEDGAKQDGETKADAHKVSVLYRRITDIISDTTLIPDSAFRDDSVPFQASGNEWGRAYGTTTQGIRSFSGAFHKILRMIKPPPGMTQTTVMIETVATRQEAIDALLHIAGQGEGEAVSEKASHFERLGGLMKQIEALREKFGKGWEPWTHCVADDPSTRLSEEEPEQESTITSPYSDKWANLFNLRYRMLLTYLTHSFQLARDGNAGRLRNLVIHKAFGEMYNLKAISGILVRLPLKQPPDQRRAGPPFQMPYTLALPMGEIDRWRLHRDLVAGVRQLNHDLQEMHECAISAGVSTTARPFLQAMKELDRTTAEWIEQVIVGLSRRRAVSP